MAVFLKRRSLPDLLWYPRAGSSQSHAPKNMGEEESRENSYNLSRGKIQTRDTECQLKPAFQRYIICSVMPLYAWFSDHWSSEHKLHEFVRITILAIFFFNDGNRLPPAPQV